jgi:hypothetical protein
MPVGDGPAPFPRGAGLSNHASQSKGTHSSAFRLIRAFSRISAQFPLSSLRPQILYHTTFSIAPQ